VEAGARLLGARCYKEQVQCVSEQRELLFRGKFGMPCGDLQCDVVENPFDNQMSLTGKTPSK
jgi:hypothetical protein